MDANSQDLHRGDRFEWHGTLWSFECYTAQGDIKAHSIRSLSNDAAFGKGHLHHCIPKEQIIIKK